MSSQWLGKNIGKSTGKRNSRKAWEEDFSGRSNPLFQDENGTTFPAEKDDSESDEERFGRARKSGLVSSQQSSFTEVNPRNSMNNSAVIREIMKTHWNLRNYQECIASLGDAAFPGDHGLYCNATWDTIVCWPATRAGATVTLPCPPLPGLDTSKLSYRTCGIDGRWEGRYPGDTSLPIGYTNYTDCYTPETYELYKKYLLNKTPAQKQMLKDAISGTRTMEVVGLLLSLVSSLISLFIFSYFRSLRCHRTRIHRNLFVSIIVQVSIRIIVYVDQFVARVQGGEIAGSPRGMSGAIYDTPILCEILYILLEYSKSVQFMWMLIEGLYLHNQIAVSVFSKRPNYVIFYIIGWCSPIPVTLAWAIAMTHSQLKSKCWIPYYSIKLIWIIESPRIAVIIINLLFLLNIIRVLVLKLQDSHHNEAQIVKVRKAIKAALFLLPLLGITNFVVMIDPPSDSVKFAIWSYSSHFLVSFQGLIISLLYCFLNGEVQATLKKRWNRFRQSRMVHSSSLRRMSRSLSVFTSLTEVPNAQKQVRGQLPPIYNGHSAPLLRDILSRQQSALSRQDSCL